MAIKLALLKMSGRTTKKVKIRSNHLQTMENMSQVESYLGYCLHFVFTSCFSYMANDCNDISYISLSLSAHGYYPRVWWPFWSRWHSRSRSQICIPGPCQIIEVDITLSNTGAPFTLNFNIKKMEMQNS